MIVLLLYESNSIATKKSLKSDIDKAKGNIDKPKIRVGVSNKHLSKDWKTRQKSRIQTKSAINKLDLIYIITFTQLLKNTYFFQIHIKHFLELGEVEK